MQSFTSSTIGRLSLISLCVAGVLALGSYTVLTITQAQHLEPYPATISVTGNGEVVAVPDVAQFSFSVTAKADSAEAAQEQSGAAVNEILSFLTQSDVEETDIKTRNYNLYPQYRWEEQICPAGSYCGPSERVPDGFEVNQTIEVKVRDTDSASAIVSGVGERGATNISRLNFVIDDTETLKAEARSQSIEVAKAKAEQLASDLGLELVRISGYYESDEGSYYDPAPYDMRTFSMEEAMDGGFGGAELPMGEDTITSEVTITYEVK